VLARLQQELIRPLTNRGALSAGRSGMSFTG
jgi:hypothetical protein